MARNTDMMIDGGGNTLANFRTAEAADKVATDVVAALSKPAFPEDIALAAKAGPAPAVVATPVFASTGDIFKDTLNNLRAARGITPENINALGQLNVQDLTEQRIADAQAVAAKPVMSAEQKAGGGQVKWVGGVNGEYQIIMPIGSPLVGSKAAGWEPGRNNLAGEPTATASTTTTTTTKTTTTPTVQSNPTLAAGGSPSGKDSSGKETFYKLEDNNNIGFYYADGSKVPTDNLIGIPQTVQFANAGWGIQGLAKGVTPADIKYADILKEAQSRKVMGGDAYIIGDVVVVNDTNGTSLYDTNGRLISGKGSVNPVGIAKGSGGITKQIDIAAVGNYNSPDYNLNSAFKNSSFGNTPVTTAGSPGAGGSVNTGIAGTFGTVAGVGFNTTGLTTEQIDAVAGIRSFLSSLGVGDLTDAVVNSIKRGYSADTIKLIMQDPNSTDPLAVAFQKRFPANKERIAAGKPAIDAADYLRAERAYAQIFQSYGVSNLANNALMSSFIAGDVSATEVTDRIALAVNRVQNADANTKAILKRNYPELTTGDIVGAMLNPKDGLPALQRKVQIAEIGGAALAQKLDTSLAGGTKASDAFGNVTTGSMGLEELASLGITKEEAQKGYGQVATIAPRSEFLSSITGGQDYTRLQAEQEVFAGTASAKRAREQLSETEIGRFSAKAGNIGSKSFGQSKTI
jgi:hypothetical protein